MSLINQMLKDLEKRSRRTSSEKTLSGLSSSSSSDSDFDSYQKKFAAILIAVVFVFAMIWLSQNKISKKNSYKNLNNVTAAQSTINSNNLANEKFSDNFLKPAVMTGIALEVQKNTTNLRFLLNRNALYRVSLDPSRHIFYLTFDQTNTAADLPSINYVQSAVKDIEISSTKNNDLQLAIYLQDETEIKNLNWFGKNNSPELQLDIEQNAVFLPKSFSSMSRQHQKIVPISMEEIATRTEMTAHRLVDQGKITQALALLQLHAPPITRNPSYHAFIAALCQQTNQASLAEQIYLELLELDSKNGMWWTGLGVALETQGKLKDAKMAYSHAREDLVNPEVKDFVEGRLNEA
jgi:hypothetical protein